MINKTLMISKSISAFIAFGTIVLICAFMAACTETKTASGEADADSIPNTPSNDDLLLYDKRPVPASADANFEDFFYTFLTDNEFLESRVQYPLAVDDHGKASSLKQGQWNDKERMQQQELFTFIYQDDDDVKLIKDSIQTPVAVTWVDLGQLSADRYDFSIVDGQWKLVKLTKTQEPDAQYKDFLDFYSRFISDTDFQLESITNPVLLTISSEGEMDEGGTAELIREEWSEFHSEMPMPEKTMAIMDYGQSIGDGLTINMMVRSITQPLFATYKFRRIAGKWTLYAVEY